MASKICFAARLLVILCLTHLILAEPLLQGSCLLGR